MGNGCNGILTNQLKCASILGNVGKNILLRLIKVVIEVKKSCLEEHKLQKF